jgi:hypothetical protein
LNKEAKAQGFKNFLMFFQMKPALARAVLIKKFPLAGLIKQAGLHQLQVTRRVKLLHPASWFFG